MDDNYRQLAKIFDNIPRICSKCSGPFEYMGAGEYKCKNCGNIEYDDYGKVRKFVDEHGPAPYHVVKKATGVNGKLVREYLDTPSSKVSFDRKCSRCGCRIATGRLCSSCQMLEGVDPLSDTTSVKQNDFSPRREPKSDGKGSMHFVVDRNKKK